MDAAGWRWCAASCPAHVPQHCTQSRYRTESHSRSSGRPPTETKPHKPSRLEVHKLTPEEPQSTWSWMKAISKAEIRAPEHLTWGFNHCNLNFKKKKLCGGQHMVLHDATCSLWIFEIPIPAITHLCTMENTTLNHNTGKFSSVFHILLILLASSSKGNTIGKVRDWQQVSHNLAYCGTTDQHMGRACGWLSASSYCAGN